MKNKITFKLIALFFACSILAGCTKTIPISYDPKQDLLTQAADLINDQAPVYEPQPDRKLIHSITFRPDGTGMYQEHQVYDFANIDIALRKSEKILLSLPQDPGTHWTIDQNPFKTSSKPFRAESFDVNPQGLDRVNYLLDITLDTNLIFTLVDDSQNELYHFRLNITGTGQSEVTATEP